MGFYDFLRWNLAWMASVAILWPLNIPLAVLTYKIRQGNGPIRMEPNELWLRCTFVTLSLALVTVGFIGVDYYLAGMDFPAGIIHMVVFIGYASVAWWLFFLFFALEDPFEGLSSFFIYMYLPITVLYLFDKLTGLWDRWLLSYAAGWLKEP